MRRIGGEVEDYTFVTKVYVLPKVTVTKISNGGVGAFTFTGNNGWVSQDITTVTAGVGVTYLFTPNHQFFLDLRGEYGLRAVQKDTATNGSSSTGCAVLALGYKYSFGR